jgi:hypothetical protein
MTKTRPKKKASTAKRKLKIGPEPKVVARATIIGGGPASVVVRFRARTGKLVRLRFSKGDLLDVGPLMKRLANADCSAVPLESEDQKRVQRELAGAEPQRTIKYSLATGWVGNRFVLPDAIIGQLATDEPKIAYEAPDGPVQANFDTGESTLPEWQEKVAKLAGHSSTMTFAISLALAATLLDVCGIEGGGVHLTGKSSKGKSSTARVARSVSGPPDLMTWSATINGVEVACCAFNGTLMCIDETGELDGTKDQQARLIGKTAFKIASGSGKLRGGTWFSVQKWKVFVLSSGEVSLEVIAAAAGEKRLAGEQVRFPNLPCTTGEYGVFETLPRGYTNSDRLANDLVEACGQYHGTALRAFLGRLTQEPDRAKSEIKQLMRQFYDYLPLGEDNGWERRFAQKFALAAAAGVLGVRWNVLPWNEEHVLEAVKSCYGRSREAVPEAEKIIKRGLIALQGFVTDPAKVIDFRKLTAAQRQAVRRKAGKGYLRDRREYGLHLVVRIEDFRSWFKEPRDADLVLHELDRQGRIKRDEKRNIITRQVKLSPDDESKLRYLVITIPEKQP